MPTKQRAAHNDLVTLIFSTLTYKMQHPVCRHFIIEGIDVNRVSLNQIPNKTTFQSKANHMRMCVFSYAYLTFSSSDLGLDPMTLIRDHELDMLKTYVHIIVK